MKFSKWENGNFHKKILYTLGQTWLFFLISSLKWGLWENWEKWDYFRDSTSLWLGILSLVPQPETWCLKLKNKFHVKQNKCILFWLKLYFKAHISHYHFQEIKCLPIDKKVEQARRFLYIHHWYVSSFYERSFWDCSWMDYKNSLIKK